MTIRTISFATLLVTVACTRSSRPTAPRAALDKLDGKPAATAPMPVDTNQLARGTYVAKIAGCAVCHTSDSTRPFAGGPDQRGPGGKGVWRAPNITPDPATGIGRWTDEQIIAAIRTGVRPDSARLVPIMPYPEYHAMTDADARALVVFLRAQKPVVNKVARSQGLDVQPVVVAPPRGNVDPVEQPQAHGKYVAALMHCGSCHTPQLGPHQGETFAGGMAFDATPAEGGGTIFSPNITSDMKTGIGKWNEDDIVRAVREMKTPDGAAIHGPMALYKDAWAALTDSDARALATYVRSVPSVDNEVVKASRQAWVERKSKILRP